MKETVKKMVYLIGAGPGDPGLITVRGKECLQKADIVVYDYLANDSLLTMVRPDAELIYVGKKSGHHTMRQSDITQLLVEKAKKGLTVARLKGGDPFIFGRGGEEAYELSRQGIPFEIIPGVSSAIAVPAYAGIPLTHREHTSTAALITGHEDPTKEESSIDWKNLAGFSGTLVFLMGIGNLEKISKKLIESGRSPDSPVAVIRNGTLPAQRTVRGTLADIARKVAEARLTPPGIIVVGDVVKLRDYLNWFESRPLFGKKVVVTRPRDQSESFVAVLSELGANCVVFPTIEIKPPEDWRELDRAVEQISIYDWIIFTSVNGVRYFFDRLKKAKKDARTLKGVQIGAIGPKTAQELEDKGFYPDLVPGTYWAEGVVQELKTYSLAGKRVLLPRPKIARDYIPRELKKLGAAVDIVEAYRTVQCEYPEEQIDTLLKQGSVDMITFTSPSTVANFMALIYGKSVREELNSIAIACIGPITAQKASEQGLNVQVIPDEYTVEALAKEILSFYKKL